LAQNPRLVWQIDRKCFGLLGGFRGWPIQWNHAKCCGADPCCHGNEILANLGYFFHKTPISRLVCHIDQMCLGLPGETTRGPISVAMATTFALGAESNRLTACIPENEQVNEEQNNRHETHDTSKCHFEANRFHQTSKILARLPPGTRTQTILGRAEVDLSSPPLSFAVFRKTAIIYATADEADAYMFYRCFFIPFFLFFFVRH